ncbi:MAG: alpha/beta fold hydrolase [Dehalococcoidia bacterium]|nr:alpha/beta fold hydrolase [Dehalococcoidia bacterium]
MARSGYAQLKDGRMFYTHDGSGEPVILLHQLGASSWVWHMVQPILARQFSVYALDMLGAGDSEKPPRADYSLETHAHNVVAFMDAMQIPTAYIVGNSVGACLTINEAGEHPDRVTRAVLIGTPPWTSQDGAQRLAQSRQNGYDANGLPKLRSLAEQKVTMPGFTEFMADQMNGVRAKSGMWAQRTMEALCNYDVPSHLSAVKCPTLVVYGDRDSIRDKEDRVAKGIAGARLHVMPAAGHSPQLERPEEVARVVADFLKQAAPQPSGAARR